jgi:roadblock/LC7 domain-containing protein
MDSSTPSYRVIYDGKEGKKYKKIYESTGYVLYYFASEKVGPKFSSDGSKLMYKADSSEKSTIGYKMVLVVNDAESKTYDEIQQQMFGPHNEVVFVAEEWKPSETRGTYTGQYFIVANGVEGKRYNVVHDPQYTPDGKSLMYIAQINNKAFLVTNGIEGKKYDEILTIPVFMPDGKHIAYGARQGNELWWIVDPI